MIWPWAYRAGSGGGEVTSGQDNGPAKLDVQVDLGSEAEAEEVAEATLQLRRDLLELYDYVYGKVRDATPNQTPGKWTFGVQGELTIARRSRPVTTPTPLPKELQQAIDHPIPGVRAAAVHELERLLRSGHAGLALAGRLALESLIQDDSRVMAAAAAAALEREAAVTHDMPASPAGPIGEETVATPPAAAGAPYLPVSSVSPHDSILPSAAIGDSEPVTEVSRAGFWRRSLAFMTEATAFYSVALITNQVSEQTSIGDNSVLAASVAALLAFFYFGGLWSSTGQSVAMMPSSRASSPPSAATSGSRASTRASKRLRAQHAEFAPSTPDEAGQAPTPADLAAVADRVEHVIAEGEPQKTKALLN
jgi:hypothetical protein